MSEVYTLYPRKVLENGPIFTQLVDHFSTNLMLMIKFDKKEESGYFMLQSQPVTTHTCKSPRIVSLKLVWDGFSYL